jgi:hypothetical protein
MGQKCEQAERTRMDKSMQRHALCFSRLLLSDYTVGSGPSPDHATAVAYGLYRRSGIGKAFFAFPHPAPKTVYCSILEDEKGVAYVTRGRKEPPEKSLGCLRFSLERSSPVPLLSLQRV